ncbi:MAG: recombinase family protein [Vicinamibacterales bacterium]
MSEKLRAAIYARKSTEQKGVADEAKSVKRQTDNARTFALSRGWTISDAHIYIDDGKSGAEFERRAGLQSLLAALQPRPPFQVLIVSEQKSLGRESYETQGLIKKLAQAGVEIFEYGHGRSLTPKNWMEKAMSSIQSWADEAHQRQASERNHEAGSAIFDRGHVAGGRVFGYRNVHIYKGEDQDGNPRKSHTEREINKKEAAVVRRIFQLYASGLGGKAIAKKLNSEGALAPKPFVRRDPTKVQPVQAWYPATVRTILCRDLYRGVAVWNRSRKRDDWGQVNQQPRPEADWKQLPPNEALRIVSDDLWERVRSRRADTAGKALRFSDGRMSGRPPKHATKNLLAGLATCGVCGGGLVVETSPRKRGRVPEYVCFRHRNHGTGVCANQRHLSVAEVNEAVLQAIEEHALTPEAVEQVIKLTERNDAQELQAALYRERKDVAKRISRYQEAIGAGGGDIAAVVAKLRELEARQRAIDVELRGVLPVPRPAAALIENRLAEWRRLLRQSTTQGRAVLQRVLRGRVTFTPCGEGYTFEAPTRFDKLFSGIVVQRPAFIKTGNGAEHIGPEDTFDGDYGRLLERAQKSGKWVASPTGFEPVF